MCHSMVFVYQHTKVIVGRGGGIEQVLERPVTQCGSRCGFERRAQDRDVGIPRTDFDCWQSELFGGFFMKEQPRNYVHNAIIS